MKKIAFVFLAALVTSCASNTKQIVVDPTTIKSQKQLEIDKNECIEIAKNYDLTTETATKAVAGAALGAGAVAGVATAVAGAVFAPAVPFIIAGGLAGGGLWGASVSKEEAEARESILNQCMDSRGYRVYSPQ